MTYQLLRLTSCSGIVVAGHGGGREGTTRWHGGQLPRYGDGTSNIQCGAVFGEIAPRLFSNDDNTSNPLLSHDQQ